jgi:putative transposase
VLLSRSQLLALRFEPYFFDSVAKAIKREAGFKARRWVVERAHSWMNRFRRLLVRWDKKPQNYLAFLHFACGLIALRAAGLFG